MDILRKEAVFIKLTTNGIKTLNKMKTQLTFDPLEPFCPRGPCSKILKTLVEQQSWRSGKNECLVNKNLNIQTDQGDQEVREDLEDQQHPNQREQIIGQKDFKI